MKCFKCAMKIQKRVSQSAGLCKSMRSVVGNGNDSIFFNALLSYDECTMIQSLNIPFAEKNTSFGCLMCSSVPGALITCTYNSI